MSSRTGLSMPPNVTVTPCCNPVPTMTTGVSPLVDPTLGEIEITVGVTRGFTGVGADGVDGALPPQPAVTNEMNETNVTIAKAADARAGAMRVRGVMTVPLQSEKRETAPKT